MKIWNIGILGASDIAYKRFLPALRKNDRICFRGIASRDSVRCEPFIQQYGGEVYSNYASVINDPKINCVYLPLPPALHAYWGEKALRAGKHLLMEKPFCTSLDDTKRLLNLSEQLGLAVHENYMFLYHKQLQEIEKLIDPKKFGAVRMIRTAFTFPFRGATDFRYNKELGGGALLDCGGYPILLAAKLLGESAELVWSNLCIDSAYGVDTSGSAVLQNDDGLTAHVFFGMNDTYRCELEIWGSDSMLTAARIFTAPPDLQPILKLQSRKGVEEIQVESDDQFLNSIQYFVQLLENPNLRNIHRKNILRQSELIEQIRLNNSKQ